MQALTNEERKKLVKQLRNIFAVSDMRTMCQQAANEIERLSYKVYELEVDLREAQASVDLQRDFVETDVNKLRTENERLAAEVARWEALQEWQDPPSWINGPTKVRAGNAVTAKAIKDFK